MKQAIVNADDFGLCIETNTAVQRGYQDGVLTSASLMANMPGFDHAVGTVMPAVPGLGVGLHVALTSGPSVAPPAQVPLLVNTRGQFQYGFVDLLRLVSGGRGAEALDQIEVEIAAQFAKVARAGVVIDHVNSHQHVHMIPAIWRVLQRVAGRMERRTVRLPGAPVPSWFGAAGLSGSVLKRLTLAACGTRTRGGAATAGKAPLIVRHPDRLAAAMNRQSMDVNMLSRVFSRLPEGTTEVLVHPSLASASTVATLAPVVSRADVSFLGASARRLEFDALVNASVRRAAERHGIKLVSVAPFARQAELSSAGGAS